MSAASAMSAFVSLLDTVCPPFRDFIGEHAETRAKLAANKSGEDNQQLEVIHQTVNAASDIEKFESQRRQIQEALNQQTYHQFRAYAQQQFVGDPIQVVSLNFLA
ncbi:unnamed protein product [Anisakis simplex]|uniref:Uncharacterized protein n=1 Tax=Anisakis simplex TaxID=6269 RepID=A0A3P6QB14_ANISI|nr:unnamed protein product [Anisakis simplex]